MIYFSKRAFGILLICVFVAACSKINPDSNSEKTKASIQIYKLVLARAEGYNNKKMIVEKALIIRSINSSNFDMIKNGLKHYNGEIQKAIDDYNNGDMNDSKIALKTIRVGENTKYQLSKIGFNDTLSYAVLYENDNYNPDTSHSSYVFLKKENGEWKIESEIME
jgi:hypothetical protein